MTARHGPGDGKRRPQGKGGESSNDQPGGKIKHQRTSRPVLCDDVADEQIAMAWDLYLEHLAELLGAVESDAMDTVDAVCSAARYIRFVERIALRAPGAVEDFLAALNDVFGDEHCQLRRLVDTARVVKP